MTVTAPERAVSVRPSEQAARDAVRVLLEYLDPMPDREGLEETPRRVVRALEEYTAGYHLNEVQVLKAFRDGAELMTSNQMVIVSNIPFLSLCEHHLAPVAGIAHVGYIPSERIAGLSKLARVVDMYARRLQVQERATEQIASAVENCLQARGVGVLVRAQHACMSHRGVKILGSVTTTSAIRGVLTDGAARAEFMQLCKDAEEHRNG